MDKLHSVKDISTKELDVQYKIIINEYLRRFVLRHGYKFAGWVGGDIGGIAEFINQYFFDIADIIYDLNNKLPKNTIFEWQDYVVEGGNIITLHAYSKGVRL